MKRNDQKWMENYQRAKLIVSMKGFHLLEKRVKGLFPRMKKGLQYKTLNEKLTDLKHSYYDLKKHYNNNFMIFDVWLWVPNQIVPRLFFGLHRFDPKENPCFDSTKKTTFGRLPLMLLSDGSLDPI